MEPMQRVILVQGDVDRVGIARLRLRCLGGPDGDVATVVVDFSGMTGCPSALFPELLRINALLQVRQIGLRLVGLTEAVVGIVADPAPVGAGDRAP